MGAATFSIYLPSFFLSLYSFPKNKKKEGPQAPHAPQAQYRWGFQDAAMLRAGSATLRAWPFI